MSYRLNGSEANLLRALRDAAAREQKMLCYWCQREMRPDFATNHALYPSGDHLVPLYAGGKTRKGNIVAACRECNSGRHPEMNRGKERRHHKTPERHHSPFAVLAKLLK